ncbi:hypothetical protein [Microbacterium sp.]|uniref:hypothetical protein n=1 Tax=Microbacterium sp. TaxID=51671 RepID=UPI002BFE7911|nr:hypothetical protein [Microbacterium sp.]HWL78323.1 hypothetical protein [Microbacterium sp.]
MDFTTSAALRLDQHRAAELTRTAELRRRAADRETEPQPAHPATRRSWWPAFGVVHAAHGH